MKLINLLIELKNSDEHIEENLETYHELEKILNTFEIIKKHKDFINWELLENSTSEVEHNLLKEAFELTQ